MAGRECRSDLVPPDLRVDDDAVQVEDDGLDQEGDPFERAVPPVAARRHVRVPARALVATPVLAVVLLFAGVLFLTVTGIGAGRPSAAANNVSAKTAIASAIASAPLSTCNFDLEGHEAMAALDLDRELAELDALPADDLATGARAFARDRDTDVDHARARSGSARGACSANSGRPPQHPAFRVGVGAEPGQGLIDDRQDLGRDRVLERRLRPPAAPSHPVLPVIEPDLRTAWSPTAARLAHGCHRRSVGSTVAAPRSGPRRRSGTVERCTSGPATLAGASS